ncbi:MAG: cytochrome P450 [Anaerolineales bacterium]
MLNTALHALDQELVSDEFFRNPYPTMHRLQDEAPVFWSESVGAWVVTRYDDVVTTFRDVAHFSNEERLGRAVEYLPPEQRANFGEFERHYATKSLIHSDPPDHTRLRALLNKAFTPRAVEALRPRVQAVVDRLLDTAPADLDLVRDLAGKLPAIVIASIVGAPAEDTERFQGWSDAILAFQGLNRPPVTALERAQRGLVGMRAYLNDLIAKRRRQPEDDLLTRLVEAESESERLSEAELLSTCVTLLVAGHETTLSLIGNGLLLLLQHPEQLQQLRDDPALMPGAIEEILRFESPVTRQPRRIKQDTTLGGQPLPAGKLAMQFLNAANRDPNYFPNPDHFDIRRQNNRHLAFGQGVHFCIGAPLARLEGPIAIGDVLRRMPNLRLAQAGADWDISKPNSRLLKSLPVLN